MARNTGRIRTRSEVCLGGCHKATPYAVEVIEALPTHLAWCFKSWLESYHDGGVDLRGARFASYSGLMTARMQRLMGRSLVLTAVTPDDNDHLLGFVVAELGFNDIPVIHYTYVKSSRREHGLGALLVRSAFSRLCGTDQPSEWHFSHATQIGKHAATRRGHNGKHNAAAAWDEAVPARRAG